MTDFWNSMRTWHDKFNASWIPSKNPEFFHNIAMLMSKYSEKSNSILDKIREATYVPWEEKLKVTIGWDLELPGKVWLAAWFVKEPIWLKFWEAFWFDFMTIWWVTWLPQPWNQKQRVFRFDDWSDIWIINAMWFNSKWLLYNISEMEKRQRKNMMPNWPLWFSLTNTATTKDEDKINEFNYEMEKTYLFYDYFVVNIGCPNQKWVIELQHNLENILDGVTKQNDKLAKKYWIPRKKIFVKIPPLTKDPENPEDLTQKQLQLIAEIVNKFKDRWVVAIVATNTAKEHNHKNETKILTQDWAILTWWASWKQIQEQSLNTVRELKKILDPEIQIIWVWWIWYDEKWEEWESAINMIDAWASAVKLLSSFVQKNVMVVHDTKKVLLNNLK